MAYDPTTTAGFVRLLIADTVEPYLFTDAEIGAFLTRTEDNPYRAAAAAIRSLVADRAKLSKRIERAGYKSEQYAISDLLTLADKIEAQANSAAGMVVGTLYGGDAVFESYRPGFQTIGEDQGLGA